MSKSIIVMLIMLVLLVAALMIPLSQMAKWEPELKQSTARNTGQQRQRQGSLLDHAGQPRQVFSLATSDQLKQEFNSRGGRPRVVAILSPTTESSLQAASYLQEVLLEEHPGLDVSVLIVWSEISSADSYEAARRASALVSDERASHYHGSAAAAAYVADVMGYPGERAWNIVMQFPGGATWEPEMPLPDRYYHQLGPGSWLGEQHFVTGNDLRNAIMAMAAELDSWRF